MVRIEESQLISGVFAVRLRPFTDERGRFLETFRKEWFPQRTWEKVQTNRVDSKANVLRGLHYHYHQVDYWYVQAGKIRAGLVDLRPSSPTYTAVQTIEMGDDNQIGLFIPVGVAHGYLTLTNAIHTYIVDNYYDGNDEFGVAWDDPDLGLDWGLTAPPIISPRDIANRRLRDIPADELPKCS
ncbi:MAG: dTDP-4-keto-6-deoxy-D-glucose epimerase [Chloroflexi bacterium]|nr:dTDP-4-keto-6-deoxy-D-glucose epimerase [Chloroflexota bacterium]